VPADTVTNSRIVAAYREKTPGSAKLAAEARELLPSGIAHDSRHLDPFGIYVERAAGPHKWDVDGHRYVDYFGGHGALLLGHNHPAVIAATAEALARGTHFGANHPLEVRWAQAVRRLVPNAERIRFTSSGTEATLMALRLARAFTGRGTLLRFRGHFHGWHDHMTSGFSSHFDGAPTVGVVAGVAGKVALADAGDLAGLRAILDANRDVAAAILEPTGATFGQVPLDPVFVRALREETAKRGILLIFDEVVTGFRVAPGGAAEALGIRPDLMSYAKIIAGGLPGGAVAGRKDVMDALDFEATKRAGREKIQHPGTYNANPVSAAAGVAALGIIATTDACARANATAARLRARLNEVIAAAGLPWGVYGTYSGFHLFMNPQGLKVTPGAFDAAAHDASVLKAQPAELARKLRLALLVHGVDTNGRCGGVVSSTHGEAEIEDTARAFAAALAMLRAEGEVAAAA
jgi:glutamate-1-semialdehyde 2,1-aminomutase